MTNKKNALLDTDFISKMYSICQDEQNRLIDKIMAMPNYEFYCHKQIEKELLNHDKEGPWVWFEVKVAKQSIHIYDDEQIMDELVAIYGMLAPMVYYEMLKNACEAYKAGYFEENFVQVARVRNISVTKEEFLENLRKDCVRIGAGNNLGELKSYVLLQVLNMKFGQQIYVFCSDDKNARNGIVAMGGARCISVLSSFIRLQKEIGFTKEEAKPYIESYMKCCLGENQKTFKVQDTSKERRICRVPCKQVFEEIFAGRIGELKTGNLRYIQ